VIGARLTGWTSLAALVAALAGCRPAAEEERAAPFACPPGASEASCLLALAGSYAGTLEGGGTWQLTVSADGLGSGTVVDATGASHELLGLLDADGRLLMTSDAGSFDGQVRLDGSVWGIWTDSDWLRGFSGQRQEGPIVLGAAVPAGTGGTGTGGTSPGVGGGDGACYVECNPPPTDPDAVTLRQCTARSSSAACVEQAMTLCATNGVGAFEHQPGCPCGGDAAAGCQEPDFYRLITSVCFFHCAGDARSRCGGGADASDCAARAAEACAAAGATLEQSAFVVDCSCSLPDVTPACYPDWYSRTACYYQCAGEAVMYCAVDEEEAACAASALDQCGAGLVEQQLVLTGCACTDREGACTPPDWL